VKARMGGSTRAAGGWFEMSLIPAMLAMTTLGPVQPGSGVNPG
jgi:hypothetical protein